MRRRKRHAEPANHERWLVSYADFITLLFAFFVVLFSTSQVDEKKVGKLALAIQVAFQELGIFPVSSTQIPLAFDDPMPFAQVQLVENIGRTTTLGRLSSLTGGALSGAPFDVAPNDLRSELEEALAQEIQSKVVKLKARREGLVVSLREIGFFKSGSATVKRESEPAVARIAAVLAPRANQLRIEGHTDNVPIRTVRFASNWELSTARATEMVKLFVTRYGFTPERLSAAGYAEFHPVAGNNTAEGRGLNRRVDIVVLVSRSEVPIPSRAEGIKLPPANSAEQER